MVVELHHMTLFVDHRRFGALVENTFANISARSCCCFVGI